MKKPPLSIFSENINFLLEKRNLKIKELAIILNQPEKTVKAWFEGRCYPMIPTLINLAKALKYRDIMKLTTVDIRKKNMPVEKLNPQTKYQIEKIKDLVEDLLA
jgi:transcriptional regulator with XRE-family HTH domain